MNERRAFIFDLDGTLIDSLDDITAALNHAMQRFDRAAVDRDQVRRWVGEGLPVLCRRALPDAGESMLTAFVREAAAFYGDHCLDRTRCYAGIIEMLEALRTRGDALAVLSNKPHAFTMRTIEGLDLRRFFIDVRGYVREDEKKPSPKLALDLAVTMGASPVEVFFVGDSAVDIATARSAHMKAVAVTWGFRDRDELQATSPDFLVDEPMSIVEL